MALQKILDTTYDVSGTIDRQELTSLAINVIDGLVHVGYKTLDGTSNMYVNQHETAQGTEFNEFMLMLGGDI